MNLHKLTKRILDADRKSLMVNPEPILEEKSVPQGMVALQNESIYVELEEKHNAEIQPKMLETMQSLKVDLESLKTNNVKQMNSKSDQGEINELILKILTNQATQKNNGHNSCSTGKKRNKNIKSCCSEETTSDI